MCHGVLAITSLRSGWKGSKTTASALLLWKEVRQWITGRSERLKCLELHSSFLVTNANYCSSHEHWQGRRLMARRQVMSPANVFTQKAIPMTKNLVLNFSRCSGVLKVTPILCILRLATGKLGHHFRTSWQNAERTSFSQCHSVMKLLEGPPPPHLTRKTKAPGIKAKHINH